MFSIPDFGDRRRGFLKGSIALALSPWLAHAAQAAAARRLSVRVAQASLVGAGNPRTEVWGYDGAVPGPELRYRQGERLRIEVENLLAVGTTVHWHGLRLPNAMDGVPHLTQAPIAARGGRFVYEFDLPDAGTYWYHPHLGTAEQLGRGLSGALIVEEPTPFPVDRDLSWVLSDWRLDRAARITADFESPMDASHAGRIGNTVTVNGAIRETFEVRAGERLRLRLINASNARIYGLRFEGHAPRVIALDGHPVEAHGPANNQVILGPGMRADLLLDCSGAPGAIHRVLDDFYSRRPYRLLDLRYGAERATSGRAGAPLAELAPNPLAQPDLVRAERRRIVFGGGMMGAMPSQREHRGVYWTIDGNPVHERDHLHAPLLTLARGGSYLIELVNQTSWHHPIHLHGHAFLVLTRDGQPIMRPHFADTVLLEPDSRAQIALVADNPGDWMLHCHVLEHQASGMSAVVRVV
ncbi:MAG: multicopper oxidase family protein [Betaproteobacteria bacterium]|nr:multicopper oxidase family protein [Betaproteobacteria bacterium]